MFFLEDMAAGLAQVSPLQRAAQEDADNIHARLDQALKSPLPDVAPGGRRFECQFCKKSFYDSWCLEDHVKSMAGRKGHPPVEASSSGAASSGGTSENPWA